MELINQSVAPAELFVSQIAPQRRIGYLALKTTLETDGSGVVRLVDDRPLPVFDATEPTDLGDLPPDLVLRQETGLDVLVIGAAYGPGRRAVESMRVALTVGDVRRELLVSGDRTWIGEGDEAQISPAVPFTRMPLTWERAFGGGSDVWIDEHTRIPIEHQANPRGRGFDLATAAERTGAGWGCPEGFPRHDYQRRLPNLEDPRSPIRTWSDDPVPYAWGLFSPALLAFHALRRGLDRGAEPEEAQSEAASATPRVAHPDLRLPIPEVGTPIVLEGCRPEGRWWFRWPPLVPQVDYVVDTRRGTFGLEPVLLVLFPEENRLTITYRYRFQLGHIETSSERSLRVRLE